MAAAPAILARPMQPSWLRRCPHCQKLFALTKTRTEQHAKMGAIAVYGCKSCGRETEYVANHPPNTV